jgi:protein NEDD1
MKETLGSVTDHGAVNLYNVNTKQMTASFNKHSGYVKGISFSPLNKLLMCTVGLDRQIIFYDIHEKLIVKKIVAPFPIQSVSFCSDGHTLAVGSQMNGQNQQCLVYDLRKSSSITLALQGHESAVNCIRFASKYDGKDAKVSGVGPMV